MEQKIEYLTRKLYKLTLDTKEAEDQYVKSTANSQLMTKELLKLEKVFQYLTLIIVFIRILFYRLLTINER